MLVMRVVDLIWTIGPVFRRRRLDDLTGSTSPPCSAWAASGCVLLLRNLGGPRARAGARSVLQGRDGSWRTLNTRTQPRPRRSARPKATASATRGIVWFVAILAGHDARLPGADVGAVRAARARRPRATTPRARRSRRRPATLPPPPNLLLDRTSAGEPGRISAHRGRRRALDLRLGRQERRRRADSDRRARRHCCSSAACRSRGTAPAKAEAPKKVGK